MELPGKSIPLSLIKEKIIKTDTVLKLVAERNEIITHLQKKLDFLSTAYRDRCQEYERNTSARELQSMRLKFAELQEKHDVVNSAYNVTVNKSLVDRQEQARQLEEQRATIRTLHQKLSLDQDSKKSKSKQENIAHIKQERTTLVLENAAYKVEKEQFLQQIKALALELREAKKAKEKKLKLENVQVYNISELEKCDSKFTDLNKKYNALQTELEKEQKLRAVVEKQLESTNRSLIEVKSELATVRDKYESTLLEQQITVETEGVELRDCAKCPQLQKELLSEKRLVAELSKKVESANRLCNESKSELESVQEKYGNVQLEERMNETESATLKVKDVQEKLNSEKCDAAKLSKELESTSRSLEDVKSELNAVKDKYESMLLEKQLNVTLESSESELNRKNQELLLELDAEKKLSNNLTKRLATNSSNSTDMKIELTSLKKQYNSLLSENEATKATCDPQKYTQLQRALDMEKQLTADLDKKVETANKNFIETRNELRHIVKKYDQLVLLQHQTSTAVECFKCTKSQESISDELSRKNDLETKVAVVEGYLDKFDIEDIFKEMCTSTTIISPINSPELPMIQITPPSPDCHTRTFETPDICDKTKVCDTISQNTIKEDITNIVRNTENCEIQNDDNIQEEVKKIMLIDNFTQTDAATEGRSIEPSQNVENIRDETKKMFLTDSFTQTVVVTGGVEPSPSTNYDKPKIETKTKLKKHLKKYNKNKAAILTALQILQGAKASLVFNNGIMLKSKVSRSNPNLDAEHAYKIFRKYSLSMTFDNGNCTSLKSSGLARQIEGLNSIFLCRWQPRWRKMMGKYSDLSRAFHVARLSRLTARIENGDVINSQLVSSPNEEMSQSSSSNIQTECLPLYSNRYAYYGLDSPTRSEEIELNSEMCNDVFNEEELRIINSDSNESLEGTAIKPVEIDKSKMKPVSRRRELTKRKLTRQRTTGRETRLSISSPSVNNAISLKRFKMDLLRELLERLRPDIRPRPKITRKRLRMRDLLRQKMKLSSTYANMHRLRSPKKSRKRTTARPALKADLKTIPCADSGSVDSGFQEDNCSKTQLGTETSSFGSLSCRTHNLRSRVDSAVTELRNTITHNLRSRTVSTEMKTATVSRSPRKMKSDPIATATITARNNKRRQSPTVEAAEMPPQKLRRVARNKEQDNSQSITDEPLREPDLEHHQVTPMLPPENQVNILLQRFMSDVSVPKLSKPTEPRTANFKRSFAGRHTRVVNEEQPPQPRSKLEVINVLPEQVDLPIEEEKFEELNESQCLKILTKFSSATNGKNEVSAVCRRLSCTDPKIIARMMLKCTYGHASEPLQKSHTPLAPDLTRTERSVIGLISTIDSQAAPTTNADEPGPLQIHVYREFELHLLQHSTGVCSEEERDATESVSRLYVACARLWSQVTRVRRFWCDMAYYQRDTFYVFTNVLFSIWSEVVPTAEYQLHESDKILNKVMFFYVLKKRNSDVFIYYRQFLNTFAKFHYKYSVDELHVKPLFEELVAKFADTQSQKLAYGLLIFFKRSTPVEILQLLQYEAVRNILNKSDAEFLLQKSRIFWLIQRIIPMVIETGCKKSLAGLSTYIIGLKTKTENTKALAHLDKLIDQCQDKSSVERI